jgi:hypothetical protein
MEGRDCDGWKRVGVERSEEKGREEKNDGVLVVCGVNWENLLHRVICLVICSRWVVVAE